MCVAHGAPHDDGTFVDCDDPGLPQLYGFCGWCWLTLSPPERDELCKYPALPQVKVVTRYEPGVRRLYVAGLVVLALLAGFGAAALLWWHHAT